MGLTNGFDPIKVIKTALGSGGEFAEVYVEDIANTSIVSEEDRIEKVISGRDRGCGIRVISKLKTYYAYTNDLTEASLLEVAGIVAKGVKEGADFGDIGAVSKQIAPGFEIKKPLSGSELSFKAGLVKKANDTARAVDKRIRQVRVVYGDGVRSVAVINSLGEWTEEERSALVFVCSAVSGDGDVIR
jgi:TldD protein